MTHFAAYGQYVENYFKCGHNMLYFQQKKSEVPIVYSTFPLSAFQIRKQTFCNRYQTSVQISTFYTVQRYSVQNLIRIWQFKAHENLRTSFENCLKMQIEKSALEGNEHLYSIYSGICMKLCESVQQCTLYTASAFRNVQLHMFVLPGLWEKSHQGVLSSPSRDDEPVSLLSWSGPGW